MSISEREKGTISLEPVIHALEEGEDFLLKRVLEYAAEAKYTRYTSTKEEDWRLTMREPAKQLIAYLRESDDVEPLRVDEKLEENPRVAFGIQEAKRHRERGVRFEWFLGLTKLIRQSFVDLVREIPLELEAKQRAVDVTCRFFDKFELGFCSEWIRYSEDDLVHDLQATNRRMTNEKNRYLTFFHSMAEPAYVVDEQMSIVEANPALEQLLQMPSEDIVGRRCSESLLCDINGNCPLEQALRERSSFTNQEIQFKRNGQRRTMLSSGGVLNDVSGKNAGGIAILLDITERIKAEEERRQLESKIQHSQKLESLGVLAGGIAHDFNNLLVGILGNAGLAMMDIAPQSPAMTCVEEIETASQRAADLCRQMLAYSGKGRFLIKRLDLNAIIREMTHLLEISTMKSAVISYGLAEELPAIEADATQIRQVIMNLITNASEAIGKRSGVISITTGAIDCDSAYLATTYLAEELPEGRYVFIEVNDTGVGMDQETKDKIFDPFFTTKRTGRGLGLAAVLGIIHGHKGALRVYSEEGKGTTFKILLPAVDAPPESSDSDTGETEWRASGTVLLVDDDETVRTVGRRTLEKLGFAVIVAQDGREAVEIYQKHLEEITCVLLDLTMPHLDGESTFRELRRIREDVRVILSSGYNEQDVVTRFAGKGLAGFIQKPYGPTELIAELRKVLGD